MTQVDLQKLTVGLSQTWSGCLRDWDRSLRSGNYPQATRYNYLLAAAQLGRYLGERSPDPDAADAAADPTLLTRAHVESFQAWMISNRSASTAVKQAQEPATVLRIAHGRRAGHQLLAPAAGTSAYGRRPGWSCTRLPSRPVPWSLPRFSRYAGTTWRSTDLWPAPQRLCRGRCWLHGRRLG
jgi:hypothetical protein